MTWKEAIKIDLETRKVSKELTKDRIEWCTFKVLCVWKLVTKYEEIKFFYLFNSMKTRFSRGGSRL